MQIIRSRYCVDIFCINLAMFGFMNFYTEIDQEDDNKVKLSRYIYAQGFHRNLFCIFVIFIQVSTYF
jgi:hypothetical protein